jgi:hypothetical protein
MAERPSSVIAYSPQTAIAFSISPNAMAERPPSVIAYSRKCDGGTPTFGDRLFSPNAMAERPPSVIAYSPQMRWRNAHLR